MIELDKVKATLQRLELLMYGHNYEILLGIEVFDHCPDYGAFVESLKKVFPDVIPESHAPVPYDLKRVIAEITAGLDYRGDKSAGLTLSETATQGVEIEQTKYLNFVRHFAAGGTDIFSYPDETGIPGYPVWWDYRFIIFNEKGQCLFTYGSASD